MQPAQLPYYGFMALPVYGTVPAPVQQAPPGFSNPMNGASWDQQSLASTFSTMSLQQPQQSDWYFDSGATSHMTSHPLLPFTCFTSAVPFSIINYRRQRVFTSCHWYWRYGSSW